MAKKDRAAGPRHGSSLGHRRQPVYCAGIDVPVLKMTALVRAFDRVKKIKIWRLYSYGLHSFGAYRHWLHCRSRLVSLRSFAT